MLAAAAACIAAFCAVLGLAYAVGLAERVDAAALDGFAALDVPRVSTVANAIVHCIDPAPYAVLCLAVLAFGLVKRGLRHVAAAALLLAGANVSSQILKPLLAHTRDISGYAHAHALSAAAFPSGHATASMALALAAVLVAPRAYRPLVALVTGVLALAVAMSVLVLNWHFPSDVLGGQLLATAWCLVALAALRAAAARWPEHGSMRRAARDAVSAPAWGTVAVLLAGAVAVAALVVASRADAVVTYAQRHTSAVAVGAAIAASGAALLAAVTALAARRS